MEDVIRLLPDAIANQIAAGEVVQRPASIVKELLENSIDAQATSITLIVKEAGKTLVQVIDNGSGMSETDARLSFERHATSKIKKAEDLFNILTMGFRGEALASIAAVAQVELKTKRIEDTLGTYICIEGSQFKNQESIASADGTSLAIKNVFFNVPARRNFLKSNPVEMRHVLDEFNRVSLANPDIEFQLFHNDLEIHHLLSGKLSQRIVGIFGKNYRKQLATCQEETPLVNIRGYIGRPENAKKTRGEQFFFVNKRYIRHAYLNHAVITAYENLIPKDYHPFYVLFLEIDPVHIDINIHPTKTEVKFDDERSIYAIVQAAVRKALSVHHLSPMLDFEIDANFSGQTHANTAIQENPLYQGTNKSQGNSFPSSKSSNQIKQRASDWEKLYQDLQKDTPETNAHWAKNEDKESLTFESGVNQMGQDSLFKLSKENNAERPVFQLHRQYILSPVKSGLLLIHQTGAYERILYDKYKKQLVAPKNITQQLLFPIDIKLNASDFQLILEIEPEIRNLGFVFVVVEAQHLQLKGVPVGIHHENHLEIFEEFIEQFKNYQSNLEVTKLEMMARALAKRTAARMRVSLSGQEMNQLIDQLFASENPNYTPEGKAIFRSLSLHELDNLLATQN